MNLFLKGFIIGIAKIIPGVSGAMIAVSFSVYDKLIEAVTHFFDDKKENFKFLLTIGSGIMLAIVCFSNIIRYFIGNYYFPTMLFFIGLIVGGTYHFSKNVEYNVKNILIMIGVILLVLGISLFQGNTNYVLKGNYLDLIMFFLGGVIEVFSSIVPGISGTALLMLIGIYDSILMLFSNLFNFSFVIENIYIYISYGVGIFVSFIFCALLISFLLKKYRKLFDTIVLGLSISSILLLLFMSFRGSLFFLEIIWGILLFGVGVLISYLFDK